MRILRIGFENLNSLRGVHSIDLENGPLADAGIFAITGPTGAGKSTILDALTLALYGRAARYGSRPNPENMMSRHTGVCSAEVVFEVPKGRFRAEWKLSRSRKDPAGNLQPAKRYLYDASGTPITQKMREVDSLLEQLIGLDYQRFLRSVLLSQGDFARFLKCEDNERSELLESLTGTQIYTQLSALCHEETNRRQEAFNIREQSLGDMVVLDDDVRKELAAETKKLQTTLTTSKKAHELLRAELERGRQLTERLDRQKDLQAEIALTASEAKRHRDDFDKLKTHLKAEVFRPALATLEQRQQTLASAKSAADTARQTVISERSALRSTLEAARIATQREIAAAEKHSAQLSASQAKIADELAANIRWLTQNEKDTALREQLPKLVASLSELRSTRASLAKFQKTEQENRAETIRLQTEKSTQEENLRKTKTEGETLNLALEALRKDRGPGLETLQAAFDKLKSQKEQSLRSEKLEARQKELNSESAKLTPEHHSLSEAITAKKTHIELLRETIAAHLLIARLEEHRAELKPGESCPLCGALEHPFAEKDKLPIDRSAQLKKEIEELALLEKSARALSDNLAKNKEALRQVKADIAECVLLLKDAPEDLNEQISLAKQKIENAQSVEKQIADGEKSQIERRGEYSRIREQVTASEKQLERCAKLAGELASDIKNSASTAGEIQTALTQSLAKFGLTCPEAGKESEAQGLLSQRLQDWQAHEDARTRLQAQIEEARHTFAKLSDQIKAANERVEDYIGAVITDKLSDIPLPADLPLIGDITKAIAQSRATRAAAEATLIERTDALTLAQTQTAAEEATLLAALQDSDFDDIACLKAAFLLKEEAQQIAQQQKDLESKQALLSGQEKQVSEDLKKLRDAAAPQGELLVDKETQFKAMQDAIDTATARVAKVNAELEQDDYHRKIHKEKAKLLAEEKQHLSAWIRLRELIGSHDGRKFRTFAQGLSLDVLLRHANRHLAKLSERYHLKRVESGALKLEIVDIHQANTTRPMESLSGGESFLVSLALALGLSDLAGRNVRIDSLFIDEGFGALDHDSLDIAVAALEGLRSSSKTVGVISHVDLLKERIGAQLRVIPGPGGISMIEEIAG